MYSSRTALYINVILIIGLYTINAALVPNTNNKHEEEDKHTISATEPKHSLKEMIDFFNLYDSVISDEEETTATNHDDEDENKSSEDSGQEIDDREIELLMLTLPRMGRVFNEQKGDEHFMTSDEINHIANNDINLARRAIPRFGKRAIPRFGKRAIPRFG